MEGTATIDGGQMEKKEFAPMPEGDYAVELFEVSDRKTKGGRGVFATFRVVGEGEYAGRRLWHIFNYDNASEVGQKIGREQLDKVIIALGGEGFEALNGNTGLLSDYVENGALIARVKFKAAEAYVNGDGVPCTSKEGNKISSFAAL